jgi:outer membrane autotransporter protein
MHDQRKVAATAILGLAFGGGIGQANSAQAATFGPFGEDTREATFAAVSNLAPSSGPSAAVSAAFRAPGAANQTVAASGAPLEQAAVATGNKNAETTASAILGACTSGANTGTPFQADCDAVATAEAGQEGAIGNLTADQLPATNNAAMRQVEVGTEIISSRLLGLRLGSLGTSANEHIAAGLLYGQTGGAASADALGGNTGLFFNVKYFDGSQDRDAYTFGYDTDGWHLTAGGDYRLGPNLIAGVMFNYTESSTDYSGNRGELGMDGWGLGTYGTYYLDSGLFLDGIIGYNWNDYDLKRQIDYRVLGADGTVTNVNQTAKSSPGGRVFFATLGGGYSIDRQSFSLTPQLSLNYVRNQVDSHRERMSDPNAWGGSWALDYDSQAYTSFTSKVGVMVAKALSTSSGVFVPQVSLDWIHEFSNDQKNINALYINDLSGTPVIISTTKPDHNYFDLSVGVSAQFANGKSAFINYNTILGYEDVSQYAITGGVRFEF